MDPALGFELESQGSEGWGRVHLLASESRVNDLVHIYQQIADGLGPDTGASDTLIHVHAGMFVLLVARVITRRTLGTFVPLSVVIVAALANEILDYLHQGRLIMPDALYDILNTIFWPFVLMVGIRVRRGKRDMTQGQRSV